MSDSEGLPDELSQKLSLEEKAMPATTNSALNELYEQRINGPEPAPKKSWEESMSELSKIPLFMDDLDVVAATEEENEMLEAIKALQSEGTKSEVVQNLKESGNEMVRAKRWRDAKEFYTKGIAVLTNKDATKFDAPKDVEEDAQLLKLLEEQIYVNRALCNFELKNYRSTTLDCAAALKINPSNVKAHYRSASALLALDKVHQALDVCYRGLKLDESNTAMKNLLAQLQSRSAVLEQRDRKRRLEQKRREQIRQMLKTALTARNIKVRGKETPPNLEGAAIQLSPDPLSPKSTLEFPVMLLYPIHSQSDLIQAFAENRALVHHLSYILPLPWDEKGEYKLSTVDCYMDTITGGMMKVGKKLTLLEVLSNGKTEVVDGLVRIYVIPSAQAQRWIEEVKLAKGKP